MTNILQKCCSYCVLQSKMRVGLVAVMSLLCRTFATTGLEIQRFWAWFLIIFGTFFVKNASQNRLQIWMHFWSPFWRHLAPIWLPCWLHFGDFCVKNVSYNRLQILMHFWSPFWRLLAPTWLPFGSQNGAAQGPRRGRAPSFFDLRRVCRSKSPSGPFSEPFWIDFISILALRGTVFHRFRLLFCF